MRAIKLRSRLALTGIGVLSHLAAPAAPPPSPSPPPPQKDGVAALERAYEEARQSYRRTRYEAQKSIQEDHLKKLQQWKARIAARDDAQLKAVIEREIRQLEEKLKREKKALEGELKNVPPFALLPGTLHSTSAPKTIEADLGRAELAGGVVRADDAAGTRLRGWQSGQAQAILRLQGQEGCKYSVELDYASTDHGRLKVRLDDTRFLPDLADTQGFDKPATVQVGEFTCEKSEIRITLSLPIHRSKDFLEIRGFRLVPRGD